MQAWCSCLGKPLLCLIESNQELAAFRFDNDQCQGVKLSACELLPGEIVVAVDKPAKGPSDD